MNRLPAERRELILRCLLEGMSIRGTARTADVSKNTVTKLLVDAARACATYQDRMLRNLPCRRLQLDEIWAFIYAKKKNVPRAKCPPPEAGDVWTWVALCPDTKIVPSWRVGDRSMDTALAFLADLRTRIPNRVQITSDSNAPYLESVRLVFGGRVDYAMLNKEFSGSHLCGSHETHILGRADPAHISTSLVERQNLTMRMAIRRFTRETNGFSKKLENHAHAVTLHYMHYNFCRVHESLRVTPAMEAGVIDRMMDVDDVVRVLEAAETSN